MQTYIKRNLERIIRGKLRHNPAVILLGPRQSGKSTLAKTILKDYKNPLYLDLERPSDMIKLSDPELFFNLNKDRLVCLDEIQRLPDIFPVLRSSIDEDRKSGRFLLLGSATGALLRQSSESLAGRISFCELTPFCIPELKGKSGRLSGRGEKGQYPVRELWLKGGFPRSFLEPDLSRSFEWREDFVRTLIERDFPLLGLHTNTSVFSRFVSMCGLANGSIFNASEFGKSLGISYHTVQNYLNVLERTFILRVLKPYQLNLRKRLVKSPKIYFRDSGILHSILGLKDFNALLGHPGYGSSWESFVIENICAALPGYEPYFFRTQTGEEIDLLLVKNRDIIAVECKTSSAPSVSDSFYNALDHLKLSSAFVLAPVKEGYRLNKRIEVLPLAHFISKYGNYSGNVIQGGLENLYFN